MTPSLLALISTVAHQRNALPRPSFTRLALLLAGLIVFLSAPLGVYCQVTPGGVAPDFSVKTLGGETVSLSALRGKVVVLDFWATSSQASTNNMVSLKRARTEFGDKDLAIISVSFDKDSKRAKEYANSYAIDWPQVCDGMSWQGELAQLYGVNQIPTTVLIDRQGRVRSVVPLGEKLVNIVRKITTEGEKATLGAEDLHFGPSAVAATDMAYRPGTRPPQSISIDQRGIASAAPLAGGGQVRGRSDIRVKVGDPAPDFSRAAVDLKKINLADFKGKVVILHIWASWHTVCQRDLQDLGSLNEKLKRYGLAVIGVSVDNNPDSAKEMIKKRFVTWPQIVEMKAEPGTIRELYGFDTLPTYFLLDKQGNIRAINSSLGPVATLAVQLLQQGGQ
ncbi:MAG: TlpA disulfide reductase family protein [bacterium]